MPKIVDHQKYRNELLSRSFEFLADKGYSNVTMRDLAKHLAVSTGTLYHYFPKKETIFEELVDFQADQDLLLAAGLSQTGTLEQRLERLMKLMASEQEYLLKQAILWLEFARQKGFDNLPLSAAATRSCKRYQDFLRQYLQIEDSALESFVAVYLSGLTIEMPLGSIEISLKKQSVLLASLIRSSQSLTKTRQTNNKK
jgi:AcrR family transcriptional regulator